MIPFAGFSWLFFLLITVAPTATVGLIVWLARLALFARARRSLRRHWLGLGLWMLFLCACAAWCGALVYDMVQMRLENTRYEAAHRVELTEPERIGDIDMPAGTRLRLHAEQDHASYLTADFPTPVSIRGIAVKRIERSVMDTYSDAYETIGNYPTSARLFGEGEASVEGWRCDAREGVGFFPAPDGRLLGLEQCRLAAGNRASGFELPTHSELLASPEGTMYTDGQRGADRWRVTPYDSEVIELHGMVITRSDLYLNADRELERLGQGYLVCPLHLGPVQYPPGTLIDIPARSQYGARPWIFSPVGKPASREGAEPVKDGQSVIQRADGTVLDTTENEQAGVYRFHESEGQVGLPACLRTATDLRSRRTGE